MTLDALRRDIEYRSRQIGRQKRDIAKLKELGIDASAAEELLARMTAKVEQLRAEQINCARGGPIPGAPRSFVARSGGTHKPPCRAARLCMRTDGSPRIGLVTCEEACAPSSERASGR